MVVSKFIEEIEKSKKKSANTVEAYRRDLLSYERYLKEKGIDVCDATSTDVASYIYLLKEEGKSGATLKRKLASIRSFYGYLKDCGCVAQNIATGITLPKTHKKEIDYLSYDEIVALLDVPDDSPSGKRDRAILEVMYATGMRVNEVVEAKVRDCNTTMGFIAFGGKQGKARIVPMGRPARMALDSYLDEVRMKMIGDKEDHGILFVNYMGNPLTRQGLWKILKANAKKAGLEERMTPHLLRNSFAVHMVLNGADIHSLQELMGHEDISATQVYMKVKKSKIKDVYDKTHPRA